ncbi:MAG: hypothetical protein LHV69_02860 [Elusimicrobia bacterium]|nr:hypothetical protein [Candidatus Obscuribacterium magneticum]
MSQSLLLVIAERSGKILAAQFVPTDNLQHEYNRLFEHFQFGNTDWDTLSHVSRTVTLVLRSRSGRLEPAAFSSHRLLLCRRADLP